MRIDRENRVKVLQNIGNYLISHADEIVPQDVGPKACKQTFTFVMDVETEVPVIGVQTEYVAVETLYGIDWSPK